MFTSYNEKHEKKRENYICKNCDFVCIYKSDFIRHCSTRKHKDVTNVTNTKSEEKYTHVCSHCAKIYTSRMGLWRHSKICKAPEKENISMTLLDDDIEHCLLYTSPSPRDS